MDKIIVITYYICWSVTIIKVILLKDFVKNKHFQDYTCVFPHNKTKTTCIDIGPTKKITEFTTAKISFKNLKTLNPISD
jgi:hypothetical protein